LGLSAKPPDTAGQTTLLVATAQLPLLQAQGTDQGVVRQGSCVAWQQISS